MNLPKLPADAIPFVLGLLTQAKVLDGKGSSAFQSLAAGIGDMMDDRNKAKVKAELASMRGEVQAAHDDFRQAARGRPAR